MVLVKTTGFCQQGQVFGILINHKTKKLKTNVLFSSKHSPIGWLARWLVLAGWLAMLAPAPAYAQESVPALARALVRGADTDSAKARAIYRWITQNIGYDWEAYRRRQPPASAPELVLRSRLAVCEGFSKLYRALCTEVGVENQIVHGFVKGQDYAPGKPVDRPNHTWNAVRLGGRWRLSDPTFGVNQLADDFYFLVNPADLIYTHYPEEARWQLLAKPVGLAAFERLPVVYPAFFSFQPEPLRYREGLVSTQRDTVHLAFGKPMGSYLGAVLQGGPLPAERDLTPRIIQKSVVSNVLVDSLVQGHLYRLDVFGAETDTSQTYGLLMTYFIDTGQPGARYTAKPDTRFQVDSVTQMPFGFVSEYVDLQAAKDQAGTKRLLEATLPHHPRNAWLRVNLGEWYEAAQQPAQAEQYFLQAIGLDPTHYRANYELGVMYYNQAVQLNQDLRQQKTKPTEQARQAVKARFQKAKPYLQQALKARPGNSQLLEVLKGME
jgi:tetratricopeptide (TPR) repeat protein